MAHGLTNREIASELVPGEATITTHAGRVLMKLGLRNPVEAVIFACESELVEARL